MHRHPSNRQHLKPLRYHTLWILLGWGLVALIVALSLWPNLAVPDLGFSASDKLGHLLAYFVLTSWFCCIYARRAHLFIAIGFVGLGLVVEVLQRFSGYRLLELGDLAANTTGVVAAWLLAATRVSSAFEWVERKSQGRAGRP